MRFCCQQDFSPFADRPLLFSLRQKEMSGDGGGEWERVSHNGIILSRQLPIGVTPFIVEMGLYLRAKSYSICCYM